MAHTYAFDVEVFPNFISAIFIDVDDESNRHIFYVHPDLPDAGERYGDLRKFLAQEMTLVGYNSIGYDQFILKAMVLRWDRHRIFKLSCDIVGNNPNLDLTEFHQMRSPWIMLDMQKILGLFTSLKQVAVNLQWHKIQDLPLPFDSSINVEQIDEIISYNINDVEITAALYHEVIGEVKLREGISKAYGVDVRTESRSGIANRLLEKLYAKASGRNPRDFKRERTYRPTLYGRDCLANNIRFNTPPMRVLLSDIKEAQLTQFDKYEAYMAVVAMVRTLKIDDNVIKTGVKQLKELVRSTKTAKTAQHIKYLLIYTQDIPELQRTLSDLQSAIEYRFKKSITIGHVTYDIGIGGLHSRDDAEILTSGEHHELIDADVTSFYPMIMILNDFSPEHLGDTFSMVFRNMVDDRINAKKNKEKLKADALKITINSIFGKMNFEHYWLYDPKSFFSVTLNGQLYLLMLIERLEMEGIEVVSANTDGVVARVHTHQKALYKRICENWEEDTDFELEYTPYAKFIRKDVNNYIVVKPNGDFKTKGALDPSISLTGGYKYPIVKRAVFEYFVHGTSVEDTLMSPEANILDFCLAQKVSMGKFAKVVFRKDGQEEELQSTNRYYVSKSGGELLKIKKDGQIIGLISGETVHVLNDYTPNKPIHDYDVQYGYYLEEIEKVIDKIESKPSPVLIRATQLSLF